MSAVGSFVWEGGVPAQQSGRPEASVFARGPVLLAAGVLLIVLLLVASQYGYHRDELYFRLLPAAWGYVDQPPLTPAIARIISQNIADDVWALRVPAALFGAASVVIVALITREVGGGRLAQALCAWGYAFGAFTLTFGHVLLTASLDLVVWPAVLLCVIRVVTRNRAQWLLAAGVIAGLSTYNKLLIVLLLTALVLALLLAGPRRSFRSPWLYAGLFAALILALPNIVYQVSNDWPQLTMGAALGAKNGASTRVLMWPFLALLIGPPLVPFWVAGVVSLLRRRSWRHLRFLAVTFFVVLVLAFAAGSQSYYSYGILACIFAVGCVPVAEFAARGTWRKALVWFAVVLNGLVSAVISLPLVPVAAVGATPILSINQASADQIGWPAYAAEVSAVAAALPDDQSNTIVLTSNYGEAGALARFAVKTLPPVYSGQNALAALGPPPPNITTVIVVGGQARTISPHFTSCTVVAILDNRLDAANEEQGDPIAVCRGPREPWSTLWPALTHLS